MAASSVTALQQLILSPLFHFSFPTTIVLHCT
jgi:hypothetical protein